MLGEATDPASSKINAGQLLTGIGAILAPIAQAGVGIYTAQLQTKLAKDQLKYQQQQTSFAPPPAYFPPPPQQTSPIIFIAIGIVVLMMFGGMFFMMSGGGEVTAGGVTGTTSGAVAAPRIARVRRVRRRPGSRSKK